MADTTVNYGLLLPDTDDFVTVGSQISDNLETIDTELKRVDDLASNPANITGKLWRTGGTPVALPGTPADIDFLASRATGGMTVEAAHQGLIIPVDGFYDVRLHPYATGGSGVNVRFEAYRARAAVASKSCVFISTYKGTVDDHSSPSSDIVPLKAGDIVRVTGFSAGGVVSTLGSDEMNGIRLSVEYRRPLGGVTPP